MHSYSFAKNIRGFVSAVGLDSLRETTTETNSTKNTDYFDRLAGNNPNSLCALAVVDADLPSAETVTLSLNLADAASTTGSGLADFGTTTLSAIVGSTATTAAQSGALGTFFQGFDLTTAQRYVRAEWSLSFSSASTAAANEARVGVAFVTGGFESLPST